MKQALQTDIESILNPNPEMLYQKTTTLIDKEIQRNKLSKCILIEGEGYQLLRSFSKHKRSAYELFKKRAQLYLIVTESPYFILQMQEEQIILIPKVLQRELQNKLLQELGQQNIVNEDCYQHDIEKDFRNGNQCENIQQQQKDENPILMKEIYECYKIIDYSLLEEVVQRYLSINQYDTQNKQLINFRFYINDEFEIIIEYKINDKNLSLKQSIKRRHLRNMIESVKPYFVDYQLDQLIKNLLLNMFQYEEINLNWQKQIIFNLTDNKLVKIDGCKYQEFKSNPRQKILIIYPKTINSKKRFLEYKILIIRHSCQLYFVNHESILMNIMYFRNPSIVQKYSEFIDWSIKRFDNFKLLPHKELMEQQLDNEILKYRELIKELSNINFINERIEYYKKQIENIVVNENVTTITEEVERYQIEQQIKELEQNIQNQLNIKQEYENICQRQLLALNQFQPYKYQQDIQQLQRIHQVLQIERTRAEIGLPIYINKNKICQMINQNQVTLLIGETGSGKSTQLIQYISEELLIDRKVLCVQPRVLAARTLAKRVAEEQLSNLGEYVGYDLGIDKKYYKGTKMIFTQDRILLNMLLQDSLLNDFDVVIVDEAHERTMNTDLLLGLLKRLLKDRKDLKLIITSATLDEQLYCNYFNCPSLTISGRLYPVTIKYYPYQDYINGVIDILIKKVISKINSGQYINNHVLVFLAGIDEINVVYNQIQEYNNDKIRILTLHGQMGYDEQYEVFRETPQVTKIILSTRIAETSLTIKDVDIVIDIGVDRFQLFDQTRNMQVTKLSWISQAQAKQRLGRAGRTLPGKCYRLYDEECFRSMPEHKIPEIQNCNLDLVVLRIKSFHIRIEQFEFLQAPKLENLLQSEKYLVQIKVLKQLDDNTEITSIGGLMAQIQTEPKISRILIEAYYRDIFWEVLSIISVMINNINLYSRDQNVGKRLSLIDGSGDLITFLNIFYQFQNQQRNPYVRKEWCINYGLNYKALRMAESTYSDIESTFWYFEKELKENIGIYAPQVLLNSNRYDGYNQIDNILKCFRSAYYPDICVYNGHQLIGYTMIKNNQSLRIYGTSSLSILNTFPQIIICADLYSSAFDFCRIAQEIPMHLIKSLPQEFQDKINSYLNNKVTYKCTQLKDIPNSFVNGLSHKYQNIYESNKFIQFKHFEANSFTLWSEKEIDLDKDIEEYKENSQKQVFAKFYGEKMMVYFKHGAEVGDIVLSMAEDHGQVNFNDVPFNVDAIRTILESNCIQFQTIFETNVTSIGYCGQIHLSSFIEAQKCVDLLNKICVRTIKESEDEFAQRYYHIFERRNQFFSLKHRTYKNKQIQYMAKITFYSCHNNGYGFLTFEKQNDAEQFFFKSFQALHLDQFLVKCEIKNQFEIRISNIPKEYDEEYFEEQIKDYCHSIQIVPPTRYKLHIKNQNQIDISEEELRKQVSNICQKHLNQQPNILLKKDKRSYKFEATLIKLMDPQLLEKFRKTINYQTGILGACRCYMSIEYKIFKQLSKNTCNQIRPIYEKLVHKISEKYHNSVKVIMREGDGQVNNIVVIGKNPNNTRGAAIILHGIMQGYPIRNRTIKNILIKQLAHQFQTEIEDIEEEFKCYINNLEIIKKGRFLVHSEENNVMKIEEAIQTRILNKIKVESTLNLKKYSFKTLLRTENNILDQLSAKYKICCDFDLARKLVKFYGNKEQTENCKQELINELSGQQDIEECEICQSEFCDKFVLSSCFHQFCKSCIVAYIVSSDAFPIKCPKDCNEQISLKDLQQVLSGPEFEKLLDKSFNLFRKSNRAVEEYMECLTPDCDELFKKGEQFYYCDNCLFSFCVKCKQEAHENKTCEEFEKFKKITNDLTDEQLKELGIKKCQKCKQGIQKSQGCNNMHCTFCDSHMCWICGTMANEKRIIYEHIQQKHNNQLYDNDNANEQQVEQQNQ